MWSLDPPSKRLEKVYSLIGLEREDHSLSGDLKYYCLEYKLYGHRATVFLSDQFFPLSFGFVLQLKVAIVCCSIEDPT